MGALFGIFAAAVGLSVAYLFAFEAGRSRARAWRAAADAAGLADLVTSDFLGVQTGLTGRVGLLRVAFERFQRGRSEKGTRIVIDGLGHPSYEFALRKEGVGSALENMTFVLHESDDDSTWSTVADADLDGGTTSKATIVITTGSNDDQVHKRGYSGTARYLRWEITAEVDSVIVPCSAYVILSNYRHAPVP